MRFIRLDESLNYLLIVMYSRASIAQRVADDGIVKRTSA